MKYVLTLDIAKGKSMVMLSLEVGEVLIEPYEIIHNLNSFNDLKNIIIKIIPINNLTVIMEATSIYSKAPEKYFKDNNFKVIVFNPMITNQRLTNIRKTKTD